MQAEIILLGHGSRRAEANQGLLQVAHKVSAIVGREVTPAFMGHAEPSLPTAVMDKIRHGAHTIIVMPLFLFRGIHVSIDIHEELKEIRTQHPEVEIIFASELGADDRIAELASFRIKEAMGGMNFITDPSLIENESMRYIRSMLHMTWNEAELPVVERLIHTTGDLALEPDILIHPQAIAAGLEALAAGASVITDVEMVRSGVAKQSLKLLGGQAHCFLNDPRVIPMAKEWGLTRTMTALRLNKEALAGSIIAIGNAPTALVEVMELAQDLSCRPALIIGMPVGFVGAKESKEILWARPELPSITVRGTRGGSPLAAAAVNALIYSAAGRTI